MGILTATIKAQMTGANVVDNRGGWWPWIREPYAGAWQQNDEWTVDTVLAHHAVFACITLISSDVGKLRPKLVEQDDDGIWTEVNSAAFSPVLRKPNRYQNHIQFKEWWTTSKLVRGNAYVLKERDRRGVVVAQYLLDPSRVQVLVAPDGSVFYQLNADNLTSLENALTVPASEIIHDRINCLFHPLVGLSPLFACGVAANLGLKIERNSASFFGKGSNPSGILTAPGEITQAQATEMSDRWNSLYTGENAGKVAVLGRGLTFEPLRMTAVDSQLIEQLKWTAETVCSAFHVPPFKIGIRDPKYSNAEIANEVYYSDCLQSHIEQFELCMDEGLGIGLGVKVEGRTLGVELDIDGLIRMDSATQITSLSEGIKGGLFTPNEARKKVDLIPLSGGDTVYMQQQQFSLEALSKRDQSDDPFATRPPPQPEPPPEAPTPEPEPQGKTFDFRAALDFIDLELKAAA